MCSTQWWYSQRLTVVNHQVIFQNMSLICHWLVVWNMNFMFPFSWEWNNIPTDELIFLRGVAKNHQCQVGNRFWNTLEPSSRNIQCVSLWPWRIPTSNGWQWGNRHGNFWSFGVPECSRYFKEISLWAQSTPIYPYSDRIVSILYFGMAPECPIFGTGWGPPVISWFRTPSKFI